MWINPDEFVLEPHSDKNKARQRGCDLGTAGEKFLEDNSRVEGKVMGGEGGGTAWVGITVKVLIVS